MSDLSIVEVTSEDLDAAKPFFNEGGPAYPQLVQAFARHRASEAERVREACAKVADEFADHQNSMAYEKRQAGGDDSFNCARASAGTRLAAAIRSLPIGAVE